MQLYRNSLKTLRNWTVQRGVWYTEAERLRSEFEKNKDISDPALSALQLAKGEAILKKYYHPDPYIVPHDFGGSKWERNVPFPFDKVGIVHGYGAEPTYE